MDTTHVFVVSLPGDLGSVRTRDTPYIVLVSDKMTDEQQRWHIDYWRSEDG